MSKHQDKIDSAGKKWDSVGKSVMGFFSRMTSDEVSLHNITPESLGLTYVTPRVIMMGYPSEEESHLGRRIDVLARYFNAKYPGRYMVWNLAEKQYDYTAFNDQVLEFSFPGYPAPPLNRMFEIVSSMAGWLAADPKNVAVVHCQTGTGRSAVAISSFLAWSRYQGSDALRCLEMLALARGTPVRSLVIPTQRRYLQYVTDLLAGSYPSPAPVMLERVIINTIPNMEKGKCRPYLQVCSTFFFRISCVFYLLFMFFLLLLVCPIPIRCSGGASSPFLLPLPLTFPLLLAPFFRSSRTASWCLLPQAARVGGGTSPATMRCSSPSTCL